MENRYNRNIGSLTASEQTCLLQKKVFIAGLGGLGGHVLDGLLRLGVGGIEAVDGDSFDETNLNRQLLCNTSNIAGFKSDAALAYAKKVNPSVHFKTHCVYLTDENAVALIEGCDIAIDCLDNIQARLVLKRACKELNIPLVHGAVKGWMAQWGVTLPSDDMLSSAYHDNTRQESPSTLPFTVSFCASMQLALCTSVLCSRDVACGQLYICDLSDQSSWF